MLEDFYEHRRLVQEILIRQDDNQMQQAKGQPSLDIEDTGSQYKLTEQN
jgi:hypothetical protein